MAQVTKTGISPLILGIVTAPMLAGRRYPESLWRCGGAELRADGVDPADVIPAVEAFAAERRRRGFGGPTVFTVRLLRDGGTWDAARAREREAFWRALASAPDPLCDFVDIEIEKAPGVGPEVWDALHRSKIKVLLSHHALDPEGAEAWPRWLETMRPFRPDAVKFAVTVSDAAAAEALLRFARKVAAEFPLSGVFGMGKAGRATRVVGPLLGCPIAYAYVENGPVAPGQMSAESLRAFFNEAIAPPGPDVSEREWMDWAEQRLKAMSHAA